MHQLQPEWELAVLVGSEAHHSHTEERQTSHDHGDDRALRGVTGLVCPTRATAYPQGSISNSGSSVRETRIVSPRPSMSREPMPIALFILPSSPSPACRHSQTSTNAWTSDSFEDDLLLATSSQQVAYMSVFQTGMHHCAQLVKRRTGCWVPNCARIQVSLLWPGIFLYQANQQVPIVRCQCHLPCLTIWPLLADTGLTWMAVSSP